MTKPDKRWLQRRLERVKVHSCADGTFGISPRWKEPYVVTSKLTDRELPPGLFTRMDTADEIERILNAWLGVT